MKDTFWVHMPDPMPDYSRTDRPPYVMRVAREWRVVVPIRGKLAARTCKQRFATKLAAEEWLQSSEGTEVIQILRSGIVGIPSTTKGDRSAHLPFGQRYAE